jgi:hypothetical protein
MNAAELIAKAFYLSGVVGRGYESITGEYSQDGLDLLNDILAEKAIDSALIPYTSHTTFETVANTEIYTVQNLVEIDCLTFNLDENTRLPLERDTQYNYFGSGRINDIKSLLTHYYAERQVDNTMKIYFFFIPDSAYTVNITGKYAFSSASLLDTLPFDQFYTSYLKYLLAKRICHFYEENFNPEHEATLQKMEEKLYQMTGEDFTSRKVSMFSRSGVNYAQANLGKGWTP